MINVTMALAPSVGQCQPHLLDSLGFYDLRLSHCLRKHALAKCYGTRDFCVHGHWFRGHRLLDTPLELLLDHCEIDLHFCLNWATNAGKVTGAELAVAPLTFALPLW